MRVYSSRLSDRYDERYTFRVSDKGSCIPQGALLTLRRVWFGSSAFFSSVWRSAIPGQDWLIL